jgi:O-antigen/teichoic acid export membrane protein
MNQPEVAAPPEQHPLRKRVFRAGLWTLVGQGASHVLRLISNFVLARLLFPEAFGLMAIVNAVNTGLQMFTEVGVRAAIIQHKHGDDEKFLNTAFTIQVIRGFLVVTVSSLLAWPVALYLGHTELMGLLPATALSSLIDSFGSTNLATANRHLAFGRLTLVTLIGAVTGLVVRLGIAFVWPSVWAFVIGGWAGSIVGMVLSHTVMPGPRNRFCWDEKSRSELLSFGRWVLVATVFVFLGSQADRFIFAKLIPLSMLGVYNIASMLVALPSDVLQRLVGSVLFPALSRVHADQRPMRATLRRVRLPVFAANGASYAGLILGGPLIVSILYDERYRAAGGFIQVLAVGAWFRTMENVNANAIMAKGNPRMNAFANIVKVVSMVVLIPAAVYLVPEHEFAAALGALVLTDVIKYVVSAVQARMLDVSDIAAELTWTSAIVTCAGAAWLFEFGSLHRLSFAARTLLEGVIYLAIWAPLLLRALKALLAERSRPAQAA